MLDKLDLKDGGRLDVSHSYDGTALLSVTSTDRKDVCLELTVSELKQLAHLLRFAAERAADKDSD